MTLGGSLLGPRRGLKGKTGDDDDYKDDGDDVETAIQSGPVVWTQEYGHVTWTKVTKYILRFYIMILTQEVTYDYKVNTDSLQEAST